MRNNGLRHGDLVEVKSPSEILATLDDRGTLAGLPFMPEMVDYCGRRFRVDKRAEKFCDTIQYTGSRRLRDTVLLEDLRCDGSGHDGCQAECRLFWKEAWLRRVAAGESPRAATDDAGRTALRALLTQNTKHTAQIDGRAVERYRCQATELLDASEHLKLWDPRAYLREYTCGNASLGRFLRVTARAALEEPLRKLGLMPRIPLAGSHKASGSEPALDLQPGDCARVKPKAEIAQTLNAEGRNRGLWFDREMLPFCGGTYQVRQRIKRFIDDRNGQMVELKTDCVTLEGVVCSGDLSLRRWFCPRAIYPYWRESWLERVGDESASSPDNPSRSAHTVSTPIGTNADATGAR